MANPLKPKQKAIPCAEAWGAVCADERLPEGVKAQLKHVIRRLSIYGQWVDSRIPPRYMILVVKPTADPPGYTKEFAAHKESPYWYAFYRRSE